MSNRYVIVALTLGALAHPRASQAQQLFRFDATLRVDLHHVGNHRKDRFMIDELRLEAAWPGSRVNLIDRQNQGTTLAEVYTAGPGGKMIFSRGYCSLFGEWKTTAQAKKRERVFSETVRLPLPTRKIRLVIKSRDRRGRWVKKFEAVLDPAAVSVRRDHRRGGLKVISLHRSGPPARNLDIVILGDGYERWQLDKFRQDASRFAKVLLSRPPFSRYRDRINIRAVESPSRESGVDEPRKGIYRDTVLSMTFDTFGSARYLMTEDNQSVHDVAANAPHDAIYIVSNTSRYGGGGIYNLYASFVSDNAYDEYVFVHEFGHSFAGLADEYYDSDVAYSGFYPRGVEPWEPNITAQRTRRKVKWRKMIAKDTPTPTPEGDRRHADKVGLFEGAGYSARGLFRPAEDCKMFNKGRKPFCPVCMKAVSKMIERYLK